MAARLATLESGIGIEHAVLYVELDFDPENAAMERVWMGVTPWAEHFAAELKTGNIKLLIEADSMTKHCVSTVTKQFNLDNAKHPLDLWFTTGNRHIFDEEHMNFPEPCFPKGFKQYQLEESKYRERMFYHSWKEYATIMYVGFRLDHHEILKTIKRYEEDMRTPRLASIAGRGNRVLTGFLSPSENNLRLSRGTKIKG